MVSEELDRLWAYRQPIETALAAFLDDSTMLFGVELSAHSHEALARLREYCLRPGKRIRGSLAALTYDNARGTHQTTQAIQLGVVLELMQSYLLLIDDVMDKSTLRRGLPTMHEVYLAEDDELADRHEAEMLAINIGCLAQHLANLQLGLIDVEPRQLLRTTQLLHTNIGVTGFGQLDDLYQKADRDVSHEDVLQKYRSKSSYYTFVNPLQLGFALAGQDDPALLAAVTAFGLPAGVAFQIHDDYLGVFGDARQLGKSNLDDLREGKFTILVQYVLEHGESAAVQKVKNILGDPTADMADVREFQTILASSGAKAHAVQEVKRHADAAKQALVSQPLGDEVLSRTLVELVDYAIARER